MAGTQNNIYMTAGEPVARFVVIPKYGITGWRLDHDNDGRKIEFQLIPTADPPFLYERDVIELYSDKEVKFFKQANRYLFREGLLAVYEGTQEPLDTTNMLTDVEVQAIALERNINVLKKKLQELTSKVSVQRINTLAVEVGRPAKTLETIKARLDELD